MPRKIFLFLGVFLILASVAFFLRERIFIGNAELLIQTEPEATIFIDGEQVGTTPYTSKMKPGEVSVRLIPTPQGGNGLALYETKVSLTEGVRTVIRHFFGPTYEMSSGFVISFQKVGKNASLAVVSSPESAELSLDGKIENTTPHKISEIAPGDYVLRISALDFSPLEIPVKTEKGYELTAIARLARLPEEPSSAEASEDENTTPEVKRVVVEILTTPTGFLRVRSEASTAATESARVTPGKKYTFLEEKKVGGRTWYKIEHEEGKSGWVSGEYAKKVEDSL